MASAPQPSRSATRTAWIVLSFAWRRALNRAAAFGAGKAGSSRRQATARKRSLLGVVAFAVFAFAIGMNGMRLTTMVVRQAATAAESRDHVVAVPPFTHAWVSSAEAARAEAASDAAREHWAEKLRQIFARQAASEGLVDPSRRSARADELLAIFEARGAAAFHERRYLVAFLPHPSEWYGSYEDMVPPLSLVGFSLVLAIITLVVLGRRDLTKASWSFEGWFVFPVDARGLLFARILETGLGAPTIWIALVPFYSVVFWCAGYGGYGVLLGLAATAYIGILAGSVRVVVETALRRFLPLRYVAWVEGALLVATPLLLACPLAAAGSRASFDAVAAWSKHLPPCVWRNPFMPLGMVSGGAHAWVVALGCTLFGLAAVAGGTTVGGWLLRDGVSAAAGPHEGTRRRARRAGGDEDDCRHPPWALAGVLRKEVISLVRDRSLLVQIFIVPIVLVGISRLGHSASFRAATATPERVAAVGFLVATFVLVTGACTALAAEVPVLWLYLSAPQPFEQVLIAKALFWGGLASLVGLAACAGIAATSAPWVVASGSALLVALAAVLGVVLYAFIATSIGVLATDALEAEPRRRVSTIKLYPFILLAGIFGYTLYASSWRGVLLQLGMSAVWALVLWRKACDRVPSLLEPSDAPRSGMTIAVLALVGLQGFLVLSDRAVDPSSGWIALVVAGLLLVATSAVFLRGVTRRADRGRAV